MWRNHKPSTAQVFANCSVCGAALNLNEPYAALQWTIETFDGATVDVQDAEVIAYYCRTCAQQLDPSRVQVPHK